MGSPSEPIIWVFIGTVIEDFTVSRNSDTKIIFVKICVRSSDFN